MLNKQNNNKNFIKISLHFLQFFKRIIINLNYLSNEEIDQEVNIRRRFIIDPEDLSQRDRFLNKHEVIYSRFIREKDEFISKNKNISVESVNNNFKSEKLYDLNKTTLVNNERVHLKTNQDIPFDYNNQYMNKSVPGNSQELIIVQSKFSQNVQENVTQNLLNNILNKDFSDNAKLNYYQNKTDIPIENNIKTIPQIATYEKVENNYIAL